MRARNIKPGFFKNEELAELGPYAQLLFLGLWQLSDREGRLEDRPKRIKAEIFPYYDPKPSVETLLNHLTEKGFIIRYKANKLKIICIINFLKHQSPHHTEKKSILPTPCDSPLSNGEPTVNPPLLDGEYPPDSLNPDYLNPDYIENPLTPLPGGKSFSPQKLAKLWNEIAPPELSRVEIPFSRNDRDMEKIRTVLKRHPEKEWWEKVIFKLFDLPFVRGINDRGWKLTLDVMVRDAEKILDGKYASKNSKEIPKSLDGLRDYAQRRVQK